MTNYKETVRKTVAIEQDFANTCEGLFSAAGVDSFNKFANNALQMYAAHLLGEQASPVITAEMRRAIRAEVKPIASRLSKGLYRYAVLIDILCQAVALNQFAGGDEIMEEFRKNANARIAKMRGTINLQSILDDAWGYEDDDENEYW